jgi:hypothetical protein
MRRFLSYGLLLLALGACKTDPVQQPGEGFDRGAMLRHYSQNLIRPAFALAATEAASLYSRGEAFVGEPTPARLAELQGAWRAAALAYQAITPLNFGPGQGDLAPMVEELALFPADGGQIEAYIAADDASLANFRRDTRGFYGAEYLLFDLQADPADISARFAAQPARGRYLLAALRDLRDRIAAASTQWAAYEAEFVARDGTDIGSSISELYNEFVKSFEALKNFKVAVPAGLRAGQTQPEPARVEAYASGYSVDLARAHLDAIETLWRGNAPGGSGPGFEEYLAEVPGGPELAAATEAQLAAVRQAFDALPPGTLAEMAQSQAPELNALAIELQKLTRFFKSDLSSLLALTITYASGDGD